MGYSCPVCGTPQRDGEHLAHHLAFTAMLHGGDHETWLDDNVEGWQDSDSGRLAQAVLPHAPETDYEEVFEDTTHHHVEERDHPAGVPHDRTDALISDDSSELDAEAREVIEEARQLTEEMLHEEETNDESSEDTDQ